MLRFGFNCIPKALNAVLWTFVIVWSKSDNRSFKLLLLFINDWQDLQIQFESKIKNGRSFNSLQMFSLLSKKLRSLLFEGTFKHSTHLYC